MVDYKKRLNYSFGNEDGSIERQALRILPSDNVVCITASGDRPLNLLLDHPRSLVSVDINQVQNALFELKWAAAQHFSFPQYLAFLTYDGSCPEIKDKQLEQLKPHISPFAYLYWQAHRLELYKGILFQGYVEKKCQTFAKVLQFLRKGVIDRLMSFDSLEEQKVFVDVAWDRFWWRKFFHIGFSKPILRCIGVASDPGLYSHVATNIPLGLYFYNKMHASLYQHLAKRNPFLQLLFRGTVPQEAFLPYLTQPGMHQILQAPSHVEIQTEDIIHYLENSPKGRFSVFSLSDVASYMPQDSFERLLKAMIHSAQGGARFCLRQLFSNHTIPSSLKKHIQRDETLEEKLEKQEPFFYYRFLVGTIH